MFKQFLVKTRRGLGNRSFLYFWKIYFPFQPWKISKQSCIDADADMNSNLLTSSKLSCVVQLKFLSGIKSWRSSFLDFDAFLWDSLKDIS